MAASGEMSLIFVALFLVVIDEDFLDFIDLIIDFSELIYSRAET